MLKVRASRKCNMVCDQVTEATGCFLKVEPQVCCKLVVFDTAGFGKADFGVRAASWCFVP